MGVTTWYQSLGLRESACTLVGVCVVGLKLGDFGNNQDRNGQRNRQDGGEQ